VILHSQTTPSTSEGDLQVDVDVRKSAPVAEPGDRDNDTSTDSDGADHDGANPYAVMFRHWWRILLAVAVVGTALVLVHDRLPLLRPGSRVIEGAKLDYVTTPGLFDTDGVRVAVAGNSRVLAGFRPAVFDAASTCTVQSVNAGFPAEPDFVPNLVQMVEAGNRPDVVLVQRPWGFGEAGGGGSAEGLDRWFEARFLLRDVSAFVDEAGGLADVFEHYRVGRDAVEQMEQDRGWYFIDGESLYDDDRLPDDLVLPDDTPDVDFVRQVPTAGPSYRQVQALIDDGVEFILIPNPERAGAFAEPDSDQSPLADSLAEVDGVSVLGPELWLYPNSAFSDPVHLNPEGAAQWSGELAALVDDRICGAG